MTDTPKSEARVWRILQGRKESLIQEMTFAAPIGKEINESMVEEIDRAISVASYDSLLTQAEALEAALARCSKALRAQVDMAKKLDAPPGLSAVVKMAWVNADETLENFRKWKEGK